MKKRFVVKKNRFNPYVYVFIALFPIMPSYFRIGNIAIVYILCVAMILFGIMNVPPRIKAPRSFLVGVVLLWIMLKTAICIIHGDILIDIYWLIYILSGFFVGILINSQKEFNNIIDIMINVAGIAALFGLLEFFSGFNVFSLLNNSNWILNYNPPRFGVTRILSSAGHTISYCLYCMFILALLFYKVANRDYKRYHLVIYVIVGLNAVLTLSRSSLICVLLCQMLLVFFCGKKYVIKALFISLLAISGVLFAVSVIFPSFYLLIKNVWYMLLAIFNDQFQELISGTFGTDNLGATGDRIRLWLWVFEDLKGHFFLGMGPGTQFQHQHSVYYDAYSLLEIKKSIEVNYLYILWKYGIIVALLETYVHLKIAISSFGLINKRWNEPVIPFGKMCSVTIICYMIAWFMVAQGTEMKIFVLLLSLLYAYYRCDSYY